MLDLIKIPVASDWLVEMLLTSKQRRPGPATSPNGKPQTQSHFTPIYTPEVLATTLQGQHFEPGRRNRLVSLFGFLNNTCAPIMDIQTFLWEWQLKHYTPPLPEWEVLAALADPIERWGPEQEEKLKANPRYREYGIRVLEDCRTIAAGGSLNGRRLGAPRGPQLNGKVHAERHRDEHTARQETRRERSERRNQMLFTARAAAVHQGPAPPAHCQLGPEHPYNIADDDWYLDKATLADMMVRNYGPDSPLALRIAQCMKAASLYCYVPAHGDRVKTNAQCRTPLHRGCLTRHAVQVRAASLPDLPPGQAYQSVWLAGSTTMTPRRDAWDADYRAMAQKWHKLWSKLTKRKHWKENLLHRSSAWRLGFPLTHLIYQIIFISDDNDPERTQALLDKICSELHATVWSKRTLRSGEAVIVQAMEDSASTLINVDQIYTRLETESDRENAFAEAAWMVGAFHAATRRLHMSQSHGLLTAAIKLAKTDEKPLCDAIDEKTGAACGRVLHLRVHLDAETETKADAGSDSQHLIPAGARDPPR